MGWREWDRTNRVMVVGLSIAIVVVLVLAVVMWRDMWQQRTTPQPTWWTPSSAGPGGSPSPSPSPTFSCSTAAGGGCTKELSEREAARDQAYADAKAGYLKFNEVRLQIVSESPPSDVRAALRPVAGPKVIDDLLVLTTLFKEEQLMQNGPSVVTFASNSRSPQWPTKELVLSVCSNETGTVILKRGSREFKDQGVVNTLSVEMAQTNGVWKVMGASERKKVDQCPAEYA